MPYYNADFLVQRNLAEGFNTVLGLMDSTGLSLASVYCSLNRLEKKGIVKSEFDEKSKSQFGGYRRKYYYLK